MSEEVPPIDGIWYPFVDDVWGDKPEELNKYFTIKSNFQYKNKLIHNYTNTEDEFRFCKEEDFVNNNLTTVVGRKKLRNLCPNSEKIRNYFEILNGEQSNESITYNIIITKCQNTTEQVCESDENIEKLLKNIQFVIRTLEEEANLYDSDNYGGNPIIVREKVFAQFQLSINSVTQNRNFLVYNTVQCKDNRFNIFKTNFFQFFKIESESFFTSTSKKIQDIYISRDGGKTSQLTNQHLLFKSEFSIAGQEQENQRNVKNIFELFSQVGGLFSSFTALVSFLGSFINRRLFLVKIIKNLYSVQDKDFQIRKLKISFLDSFSDIKQSLREMSVCKKIKFCQKKLQFTYQQRLFNKARENIHEELDVVHLLKTVQKLKAGLSAVIQNDKDIIKKTKKILWSKSLIEENENLIQNDFLDFINKDDNVFAVFDNDKVVLKERKPKPKLKQRVIGLSLKDYIQRTKKDQTNRGQSNQRLQSHTEISIENLSIDQIKS